jgi:hypothetical protein
MVGFWMVVLMEVYISNFGAGTAVEQCLLSLV